MSPYVFRTHEEIAGALVKFLAKLPDQEQNGILIAGEDFSPRTLAEAIKEKRQPVYDDQTTMLHELAIHEHVDPVEMVDWYTRQK